MCFCRLKLGRAQESEGEIANRSGGDPNRPEFHWLFGLVVGEHKKVTVSFDRASHGVHMTPFLTHF